MPSTRHDWPELARLLEPCDGELRPFIQHATGRQPSSAQLIVPGVPLSFAGAEWDLTAAPTRGLASSGVHAARLDLAFRTSSGTARDCAVGVGLRLGCWSADSYLLLPGVAYNGNRFESRPAAYPPLLCAPEDIGPDVATIVSDIPRLNIHPGPSRIDQTTQDTATPAIGCYLPRCGRGVLILTDPRTSVGTSGLAVVENDERTCAEFMVTAPAVRDHVVGGTQGRDWSAGETVELRLLLDSFPCRSIQDLFDRFFTLRKQLTGPVELVHSIPMSAAWEIQERKYNAQNWEPVRHYYSVGMRKSRYQDWQVGWVGGGMVTHPLLFEGSSISKARALLTLDYLVGSQAASGFLHGIGYRGRWYGDGFDHPHAARWHLIRKSADALYFFVKQLMLLATMDRSGA